MRALLLTGLLLAPFQCASHPPADREREDTPGDQRLVAYVVPEDGAQLTVPALRTGLRDRLPDVMIPGAVEFLERLPLTANGKVNTAALPLPRCAI